MLRPKGQKTVCLWGEGGPDGRPFPGLGISTTTDIASGTFTQVPWQNASSLSPSPLSADGLWLQTLGPGEDEVKLEGGTHMHALSSGDLLTFYAAATPGWVAHGNYTVGWLILDGGDPTRIVQRSTTHVLIPTYDYERTGNVCGVRCAVCGACGLCCVCCVLCGACCVELYANTGSVPLLLFLSFFPPGTTTRRSAAARRAARTRGSGRT